MRLILPSLTLMLACSGAAFAIDDANTSPTDAQIAAVLTAAESVVTSTDANASGSVTIDGKTYAVSKTADGKISITPAGGVAAVVSISLANGALAITSISINGASHAPTAQPVASSGGSSGGTAGGSSGSTAGGNTGTGSSLPSGGTGSGSVGGGGAPGTPNNLNTTPSPH